VSIQCSTPLPFSPPLSFLLFILALYSWYNTEDEAIDWLRNKKPDIIFVMYRLVAVLVFIIIRLTHYHPHAGSWLRRFRVDSMCFIFTGKGLGFFRVLPHSAISHFLQRHGGYRAAAKDPRCFVQQCTLRCNLFDRGWRQPGSQITNNLQSHVFTPPPPPPLFPICRRPMCFRYTIDLLMQLLGRLRLRSGKLTLLLNKSLLQRAIGCVPVPALTHDMQYAATLHSARASCLFSIGLKKTLALWKYAKCCSLLIFQRIYTRAIPIPFYLLYRLIIAMRRLMDEDAPVPGAIELLTWDQSRQLALKALGRFGPYGRAINENWCSVCNQ
jgi:hypothetical protein